MPVHSVSESQLRDSCRRALEGLELWLRRLIDCQLTVSYGPDYVNAQRQDGSRVIKKDLAEILAKRRSGNPTRFIRPVDAAFLPEQIQIVCNPRLYREHFRIALGGAFPGGNECLRILLNRLVESRNALAHANVISAHDAYRILCYSADVIEGLKAYYVEVNMASLYNVPTVVRIIDSLGHVVHLSQSNRNPDGPAIVDFSRNEGSYLHCGDTLSIEVEVDPAFGPDEYQVEWSIANVGGPRTSGSRFHLVLTEHYVSTRFCAVCRVKSNRSWHKLGSYDDQVDIAYKVLPPS